jgi:5-methylthioadenosine/S-adenosylhomocysteine deaminase
VLARGIYEDLSPPHSPPFTGGLAPLPTPALDADGERVMVLLGALEAIRSGTTLVLEEGSGIEAYGEALAATGLRLVLCERAWDRANASIGQPGPFVIDAGLGQKCLTRITGLHRRWHGAADGRVQVGLAAWAPDMCSPELLALLRKRQDELGCLASVHLNQIWGEVAAVQEQRGMLPTDYLARAGFLSDRLVAAHCRCMTAEEERVLGAAASRHAPTSWSAPAAASRSAATTWPRTWSRSCAPRSSWSACAARTAASRRPRRCSPGARATATRRSASPTAACSSPAAARI